MEKAESTNNKGVPIEGKPPHLTKDVINSLQTQEPMVHTSASTSCEQKSVKLNLDAISVIEQQQLLTTTLNDRAISSPPPELQTELDASAYLHLNLLTELARNKSLAVSGSIERKPKSFINPEQGTSKCTPGNNVTRSDSGRVMKKAKHSWQVKNLNGSSTQCLRLGVSKSLKKHDMKARDRQEENIVNINNHSKRTWTPRKKSVSLSCKDESVEPQTKRPCIPNAASLLKDLSEGREGLTENKKEQTICESVSATKHAITAGKSSRTLSRTSRISEHQSYITAGGSQSKASQNNLVTFMSQPQDLVLPQKDAANEASPASVPSTGEDSDYHRREEGIHHSKWAGTVSHLYQWQNQQVAKSIVDNAINKTLEYLGFSPTSMDQSSSNTLASQCRSVENQAVSAVIQQQGLLSEASDTDHTPQQQRALLPRLHPIINRITHYSESIFAQNMDAPMTHLGNQGRTPIIVEETVSVSDEESLTLPDRVSVLCRNSSHFSSTDSAEGSTCTENSSSSVSENSPTALATCDINLPTTFDSFATPSAKDILDQAVTVAISHRGLSVSDCAQ